MIKNTEETIEMIQEFLDDVSELTKETVVKRIHEIINQYQHCDLCGAKIVYSKFDIPNWNMKDESHYCCAECENTDISITKVDMTQEEEV